MTIIEALAAGRPVVATKVGGVPDVVDEGETGFLVRPHDTHALAERLEILAGDPVRRRAMGELGRERVLERYAVERLVGRRRRALPRAARDDVGDEPAVAVERDLAVGLALDPGPAAVAHPVERETPLDDVADHARDELGPARRHHDPAADLLDDPDDLAVRVGGDEHRPPRGEDPVEPARDDEPGEATREPDVVEVAGGERERQPLARLVVEEAAPSAVTSRRCASRVSSPCRAPKPITMIRSRSRSRRNVAARTSVSRSWACPMLPECMTTNSSSSPAPPTRRSAGAAAGSRVVSTQLGITSIRPSGAPLCSRRSFIVSPIATTRSARRR